MTSAATRTRLGDVAEVAGGAVPAKPVDAPTSLTHPFVGIAEIGSGGALGSRLVATDEVPPNATTLSIGDVAVALMSSIGASLLVTSRQAGALLGRECAVLRPVSPDVRGAWIYVWTQSEDFAEQVERHVTGTTMPRLSRRALVDFTLPIPDQGVQTEAESLIAEFDEALARTGQVVADLSELRRLELQLRIADVEVTGP